jgi:hypothetical protein
MALMSRLGSSFGQRSKASLTACAKISRAYKPSFFPNLDKPALTMLTSGLPSKPEIPFHPPIFYINERLKPMQVKNHIYLNSTSKSKAPKCGLKRVKSSKCYACLL